MLIATGGDDNAARIYQLSKDFKRHEEKLVVRHAEAPVTSVDISRDMSLLVVGSKDGNAYVCDIANKGTIV